jgi:hypothetical protein
MQLSFLHRLFNESLLAGFAILACGLQTWGQPPPTPAPPGGDPSQPAFRPNSGGINQPQNQMTSRSQTNTTAPGFAYPQITYPPAQNYTSNNSGAPGWGGPWGVPATGRGSRVGNAWAGYGQAMGETLNGSANVIAADGQWRIADQQAKLVGQEVKSAKIDNQRKALDEWLYERDATPTLQDERERDQWEQLRRSRNNPPITEIWSAKALNDLLDSVRKSYSPVQPGPMVPIPPNTLNRINFTSGTTYRGTGLLKNGGALEWPGSLMDSTFEKMRVSTDEMIKKAVGQASSNSQIEAGLVRKIERSIDEMTDQVNSLARADNITPTDSIEARRYLRNLRESCGVLRQPEVGRQFAPPVNPQTGTVPDLIGQMNAGGMKFAPAGPGEENAYNAMYQALGLYERNLAQTAGGPVSTARK